MPAGPEYSGLADSTGASTRAYDYDAFGVEKDPDPLDENPFRYCGEYFDRETETYYLRARYYDPTIGRFTQQDTHWTTANSIYGDNPQKINEREDKLGLKSYSYAPQITAIMQSGNLYVYGVSNPVNWLDWSGDFIVSALTATLISAAISGAINIATTCLAAKVTGQEIHAMDIIIAGASGAFAGSGIKGLIIAGGVISGIYTAYSAYQSGASLGGALVSGVVNSLVTIGSPSNITNSVTGIGPYEVVNKTVQIGYKEMAFAATDAVFSAGSNLVSATTTKSMPVVSPRKGNPSNSTATYNVQPKKPNTAPASAPLAPSRSGGSAQKMLMVMW